MQESCSKSYLQLICKIMFLIKLFLSGVLITECLFWGYSLWFYIRLRDVSDNIFEPFISMNK